MDGGAWWAAVYGVAQSRTRLKRLSSSRTSYCLPGLVQERRTEFSSGHKGDHPEIQREERGLRGSPGWERVKRESGFVHNTGECGLQRL